MKNAFIFCCLTLVATLYASNIAASNIDDDQRSAQTAPLPMKEKCIIGGVTVLSMVLITFIFVGVPYFLSGNTPMITLSNSANLNDSNRTGNSTQAPPLTTTPRQAP